jgi:hypothetical protein
MCATVSPNSDKAPGGRKLCRQTFRTANLFTDVPENSKAEQSSFKDAKTIREELSCNRKWQKALGSFFPALNSYCSALERHKEPKLVLLEPSGHEDSEYVRKKCMAHL